MVTTSSYSPQYLAQLVLICDRNVFGVLDFSSRINSHVCRELTFIVSMKITTMLNICIPVNRNIEWERLHFSLSPLSLFPLFETSFSFLCQNQKYIFSFLTLFKTLLRIATVLEVTLKGEISHSLIAK